MDLEEGRVVKLVNAYGLNTVQCDTGRRMNCRTDLNFIGSTLFDDYWPQQKPASVTQ